MNKAEWARANPEKVKVSAKRYREKIAADPERVVARNIKSSLWRSTKIQNDAEFRIRERLRRGEYRKTLEGWARIQVNFLRRRATKLNVPFCLSITELLSAIPTNGMCPIFQRQFVFGRRDPLNMSVDRLRGELGYIAANIRIISQEANLIKRNCSDPEIFQRLADWLSDELAARRDDESRRAA